MKNNNHYALIMAGGIGSRFWPSSTQKKPKQFLDILGTGESLLQKTFSRIEKIVPKENIFILTNSAYEKLILDQLNELHSSQVLIEPTMRNTAPCLLYAVFKIKSLNPNAQILTCPSDHWIENEEVFQQEILNGLNYCEKNNNLLTLGISPTFPNTGYGYIELGDKITESNIHAVNSFKEKPNIEKAKYFLESKNYLWNAGIFIWNVQTILNSFKEFQPTMYAIFEKGKNIYNTNKEASFITKYYPKAEDISIDYAIIEKAKNVSVLRTTFSWNDLGSWENLYNILPKNGKQNVLINNTATLVDTENTLVKSYSDKKKIVIKGLKDYIIVDEEDALLILPKSDSQELKKIVKSE